MSGESTSLPIEQFVQALTRQLDVAQSAMALKAKNFKLPLTFAVKDLTLDLRTHVEVVQSEVRVRPAGPGDKDASLLHLALTTITKPMIDENAVETLAAPEEKTVKQAMAEQGEHLSDDEQRRLEWVGVNTVSQLRELQRRRGTEAIQRVAALPVERLRAALMHSAQPSISRVAPEVSSDTGGSSITRLRIRGQNLLGQNRRPAVRIAGQEVPIVEAADHELVIAPLAHQMSGDLIVETDPGVVTATKLSFPQPAAVPVPDHNNGAPT